MISKHGQTRVLGGPRAINSPIDASVKGLISDVVMPMAPTALERWFMSMSNIVNKALS
jgi:hypothetical protein